MVAIITGLMEVKRAHDSDGSHKKDSQAAERKRQAFEVCPRDQIGQTPMKYKDLGTGNVANGATCAPVHVRPTYSKIWQTGNVATPSQYGTGYANNLCFPTTEVQAAQRSIDEEASLAPVEQAATYTAPFLETSPSFSVRDAKGSQEIDAGDQTRIFARLQMARAKSPAQRDMEEIGRSKGDGERMSVEPEHDASTVGLPIDFEGDECPGWHELLDFMELSKSRLLEDEAALRLLRSLEPRIIGKSNWFFEPHTLFLSLARMANISQRRQRFGEYLIEAPREWYCLSMVYKHGYESEHALASKENCGCPLSQKTCLQARIRRGRLGAFDVRFR